MKDHSALLLAVSELEQSAARIRRLQFRKKLKSRDYAHGTLPWAKLIYEIQGMATAVSVLELRISELKETISRSGIEIPQNSQNQTGEARYSPFSSR